jgi:hypothetical protein
LGSPRDQSFKACGFAAAEVPAMSLELLSTIAAFGTFIVIAATAIAAFVQLTHIRRSNQLAGLQNALDMLLSPDVRELVNYVRHDLAERMNDPAFRAGLRETPVDRRLHPEMYLCDMYNHIGSFVRNGLIDERVYLQTEWYNVSLYWKLLRGVVREGREARPFIFENFEWLAARAHRWFIAHPNGDYPSDESRMVELSTRGAAD